MSHQGEVKPETGSDARSFDEGNPSRRMSRRRAMTCLAWAGAGILWTLDGGVPRGLSLGAPAAAADKAARHALSFVQISDSHIGFNKAANPIRRPRCNWPSIESAAHRSVPRSCSTRATSVICRAPRNSIPRSRS